MSFRSKPVVLGTTDTDIYEVPVTLSAVVVLGIHNVVPSPAPSFTLKYYKQSTDTTTTLGTITFGSSPSIKYEVPFSMEPGDKLIGVASVASSVVVTPFITDNAAIPTAVGFDPIGVWNSGTTYGRNDIVRVEGVASPYTPGKTYISLQDNNQNQDPTTETAYWMVLVEDGAQGPAGTGDLSSSDIGVTVQPYDPDTLKADTADDLTAGFTSTSVDQGTKSSGTFTPAFASGNVQHYTNDGAHTLAPPSSGNGSIVIDVTNDSSAGAITTSGFTKVSGDTLTTTNGHKFRLFITVGNAGSHLHVQAMQ